MNLKAYIESGILEAYVLGVLTSQVEAEVAATIALYPKLQEELMAIETALHLFSESLAVDPPSEVQEKIWKFIQGLAENAGDSPGNTAHQDEPAV